MPDAPGWAAVRVQPWPLGRGRLCWARGRVPTPRGPVAVSWSVERAAAGGVETLALNVSLPANVRATVAVPLSSMIVSWEASVSVPAMFMKLRWQIVVPLKQ